MRFGSVCSGIEAASVAWEPLGWQAAWFAEIEAFPSAVLAHRWPEVANHGNMLKLPEMVARGEIEAPDVLVGGTPCQAFSVAGKRGSLEDERGALTLAYVELLNEIDRRRTADGLDQCVAVWENVPGVLSTKDNAFGCFLAGLAGEDQPLFPAGPRWSNAGCVYGPARTVAWRVLDAQYFGVAQRRRRVFVVASARDGFDPASVLFEFDGLRRDTPPRREAGKKPAPTISARPTGGGGLGTDFDLDGGLICAEIAPTLNAHFGDKQGLEDQHINGGGASLSPPVANPLTARMHKGINTTLDEGQTLIANGGAFDVAHSLRAEGFDASEDGTGRGTPIVPVAGTICRDSFSGGAGGRPEGAVAGHFIPIAIQERAVSENPNAGPDGAGIRTDGVAYTLEARTVPQAIAFDCKGSQVQHDDTGSSPTLRAMGHAASHQNAGGQLAIATPWAVRRLTPRECERLQGFPDDFTRIPYRGKPAADGPRYKALGNSMAVPCMRFIGARIDAQRVADSAAEAAE